MTEESHSSTPAFLALLRTAEPCQAICLSVAFSGSFRELSGVIRELTTGGLVLETELGIEWISKDEIRSWRLPKTVPDLTVSAEPSSPEPAVVPRGVPSDDADESTVPSSSGTASPSATTTDNIASGATIPTDLQNLELLFAGDPQLSLPPPLFQYSNLHKSAQQDLSRWKNRFDYAMKVHEPARIAQDVAQIAELAESLGSASLFCLAGTLAILSGLGPGRARPLLQQALQLDPELQQAAIALASQAIEERDWERASDSLLHAIRAPGVFDKTTLIRVLGQCVVRSNTSKLPPLGALLVSDLPETGRRLATNLVALAVRDDAGAFAAAIAGDVELFRKTKTGNDLFPWQEEIPVEDTRCHVSSRPSGATSQHDDSRRGRVSMYYPTRNFGFIVEDSTGQTWFFHKSTVTSDSLFRSLLEGVVRQDVLFAGSNEVQYGKYPQASQVAMLSEDSAVDIAAAKRAPLHVRLAGMPKDGSAYAKAKEAEQLDQLDRAQSFLREEIKRNGRHKKSAIKDLAALMNRTGNPEAAIGLLDSHRDSFAQAEWASLDQLKVQFCVKARLYPAAAELLNSLARNCQVRSKKIDYFRQEAYCFLVAGDYDTALKKLATLLQKHPNDNATLLLMTKVKEAKQSGIRPTEVAVARDDGERDDVLASLALGLSPIARRQLDSCELRGLDARTKESRNFSREDFQQLERMLESLKGRRPRERADYLLTLARLCELSPEAAGRRNLHRLLRWHFHAMAEASTVEGAPVDVVRCYSVESLALCPVKVVDERDALEIEDAWAMLLATYCTDGVDQTAVLQAKHGQRLLHVLKELTGKRGPWRRFSDDASYYRLRSVSAFGQLTTRLENFDGLSSTFEPVDKERARLKDDEGAFASLALDAVSADRFRKAREALAQRIPVARFELDKTRMSDFVRLLGDAAEYALERHFREREARLLRLDIEFARCLEDCQRFPTHLAVERMIPALGNLRELLRRDFGNGEETCPTLALRNVLDNDFYVENDGAVSLRLQLASNDESAPPIEAIGLMLEHGEGEPCHSPEPLHGGQSREIELTVRPTAKQISDRAFTVDVFVEYRTRNGSTERTTAFPLAVRLGEPAFEEIANPYGRYSGGSPVDDDAMFFGRVSLVNRIVSHLSAGKGGQCFVLYGQKRSGKSSVLRQVEKRLLKPVLFSALSAGTFTPANLWASFARLFIQELGFRLEDASDRIPSDWPSRADVEAGPLEAIRLASRQLSRMGYQVVVAIDEFTYIFESARSDIESFMRGWKALLEGNNFNALLVGQDTMPRFKQAFPNEFGVTHDERLSYLEEEEAHRLASEPILLDGATRYRGQALERLFKLTAGSPFFLQIACDRLVRHLNSRQAAFVTEADIDQVARSMTVGADALPPERFDALVTAAGEGVATVPREELWMILARIARESLHSGWCYRSVLAELPSSREALKDLLDREILISEGDRVSIRVGLFSSWLRANQ